MERHKSEEMIKKGPWTAEEDEVLVKFVNKYGPRDWSSIRSMGLLPRTGKSCRLRWVNKLRPNLKIGCKFSAEEERVVIEMQARFGNKWAAIASHLQGRTDNDVKNFWSSRKKRLARILQSTSPPRQTKSHKSKDNALAVHEMPTLQAPEFTSPQMKEESYSKFQPCSSSSMEDPKMIHKMPQPNFMNPNMANIDSSQPSLNTTETDTKPSNDILLQLSFTHLPNSKLDLPILAESHAEPNFLDVFTSHQQQAFELGDVSQLINFGSPFFEVEGIGRDDGRANNDRLASPDSFFDELPSDMFDYLEPCPSSSPL
ncbi:unnamed protein product [Camellia sinensis]